MRRDRQAPEHKTDIMLWPSAVQSPGEVIETELPDSRVEQDCLQSFRIAKSSVARHGGAFGAVGCQVYCQTDGTLR
jgi:hypothetical protein